MLTIDWIPSKITLFDVKHSCSSGRQQRNDQQKVIDGSHQKKQQTGAENKPRGFIVAITEQQGKCPDTDRIGHHFCVGLLCLGEYVSINKNPGDGCDDSGSHTPTLCST